MLHTCEASEEKPASRRSSPLPLLGAGACALALLLGAASLERYPWRRRLRRGTPTLSAFSRDLTRAAMAGELDPVIGRDQEIERVVAILSRRSKNNPVLVGEPGVGKTAIVEGLAQRIARKDVPQGLREKRVLALSVGALVAGTKYRGEFESRVRGVLDEMRRAARDVILFIDELHTLVGAGAAQGALDLSSMIKPELARGDLQCIGATTFDEYRAHIEADAALERRFQPVMIAEPTIEQTVAILRGLRPQYTAHHGVIISDDALEAAAVLSARYITDRYLPDKAIDLMDEAAATVTLQSTSDAQAAQVSSADISAIVAKWTGIAQGNLNETQTLRLLELESILRKRIVGQDNAVATVAHAIRRARTGLKDPRKPVGGFLFIGPNGVGKTELARSLATALFGTEDAVVRIDLAEYTEPHAISRLVGAPPGYMGHDKPGRLTEMVRRRPYCVVLFDELDKAHADVAAMVLQILDDGRLTDAKGHTIDFRHAVVILTSNADADALTRTMQPELLNRIDEVVRFAPLGVMEIEAIVDLQMHAVCERLADRNVTLSLTQEARRYITHESIAAGSGARYVARTITRLITTPLSDALLGGEIPEGATLCAQLHDEKIMLKRVTAAG